MEKASNLPVVFPDFDRQICKLPVTQVWHCAHAWLIVSEAALHIYIYSMVSTLMYFSPSLSLSQVKFIDFFVIGLFEAWHSECFTGPHCLPSGVYSPLSPSFSPSPIPSGFCPIPVLMEQLSTNYDYWKGQYESPTSSEEETDNVRSSSLQYYCVCSNDLLGVFGAMCLSLTLASKNSSESAEIL